VPDYEVSGDVDLPADGILTTDVTLAASIDDGDGGTWTATVAIAQSQTADNTGVADLLTDIQNALVTAEVLDGGSPTGAYASQFITAASRSGRLVLSGERPFTIDGDDSTATAEIGLTGIGPGSDGVATQPAPYEELFPYDDEASQRVTLPASRSVVDDVTLHMRVYDSYPGPESEYDVTIPAALTANNTTIDDLIDDINGVLPADVRAEEEDGFIVFVCDHQFQIEYSSENEKLLGLVDMPTEQLDANRASNDGVLTDDVTLVLWVNLGMQKIVGEVTIPAAATADNGDGGMIMDLVLDIQEALNTASYVNLDGDVYGNDPATEYFGDDPVTVGGAADPIVKVKLKNGKILLASQYELQVFSEFSDPEVGTLQSEHAELLGLDSVAGGGERESTRPFNIIAAASGSEVIFGSVENPAGSVYIAGSVFSDHQITLVEGPDTKLDLDWSALLQKRATWNSRPKTRSP